MFNVPAGWSNFLFSYEVNGEKYSLTVPGTDQKEALREARRHFRNVVYDGVLVEEIPFRSGEPA